MGHDEVPPGPLQGRMGTSTRQVSKVDIQRTSKNGLAAIPQQDRISSSAQSQSVFGYPASSWNRIAILIGFTELSIHLTLIG